MKWFQYTQNNSGGHMTVNKYVSDYVLIQAPSATLADDHAVKIGIYFNGVEYGGDCECCGDRWGTAWKKGDSEPLIYGQPLSNYSEEVVRIYPYGSVEPVSIFDFQKNPPMVIEPS